MGTIRSGANGENRAKKFRLPVKYKEHLEQMKQKEARAAVKRRGAFTVIEGGKKD